jgi:hypothetical protein
LEENKLLDYIAMLTDEQIEKLVNQLPLLTSLLSEQAQLLEQSEQKQ